MSFTWTSQPPVSPPNLTSLEYGVWKFRQRAGLAHQDETYEAGLSDETIIDMMFVDSIIVNNVLYYQPLITLARFIEADPEQRTESYEGDAKDKWTDPYLRAEALRKEQEELNRRIIPFYVPKFYNPGPVLVRWGRRRAER